VRKDFAPFYLSRSRLGLVNKTIVRQSSCISIRNKALSFQMNSVRCALENGRISLMLEATLLRPTTLPISLGGGETHVMWHLMIRKRQMM
jgi:hypothetical protein